MHRLVGQHIETLKPYVPGKPIEELERELGIKNPIKLASNENPLGPSPKALKAMQEVLGKNHLYPDGAAHNMISALAEFHGVGREEIICGNGSNELLTMTARTFGAYGRDKVVLSEYSFAAYAIVSQAHNLEIEWVATKAGFINDLGAILEAIDERTKIVFLANPNNPTGTYAGQEDLREFLRAVPEHVVVLVDEAYHEYVRAEDYESAERMRGLHERLIITRTLSKCCGLAGARAGYAIAPAKMVDRMNRLREPFNCNTMAQAALPAALSDVDFVRRSIEVNEAGRAVFEQGLKQMSSMGVSFVPSQTNFLLVELPVEGKAVYDRMLMQGVIVRPMAGYGLRDHLRISLSTPEHMQRCLEVLSAVVEELPGEGAR